MEYKVIKTNTTEQLEAELNRLAKDGWHLHTLAVGDGTLESVSPYTAVMKRDEPHRG